MEKDNTTPLGDADTDMGTTVLLREERGRNGSVKFGDGDIRAKTEEEAKIQLSSAHCFPSKISICDLYR